MIRTYCKISQKAYECSKTAELFILIYVLMLLITC